MVEPRPDNIRFDLEALQGVALFNRDVGFRENVPCIYLGGRIVNRHANRRLSREHFPVAGRTAAATLRYLPLAKVERAVLRDRDDGVVKNPPTHDCPQLRPQRSDQRQTLLAMNVEDMVDGNPG